MGKGFESLSRGEADRLLEARVREDRFSIGERNPLLAHLYNLLSSFPSYEAVLEDGSITEEVAADHFGVPDDKRITRFKTAEEALLEGKFPLLAVLKHFKVDRAKLADGVRARTSQTKDAVGAVLQEAAK